MIGAFWMTNWIRHPKIIQRGKKSSDSVGDREKVKTCPKMFQTLASVQMSLGKLPTVKIG
jgi:hypothetical protein